MHLSSFLSLILTPALISAAPAAGTGSNGCTPASPAALQHVKSKFTSAGLAPTYIKGFNPTVLAEVTYKVATGGQVAVDLGNTFNTTDTLIEPTVFITPEAAYPDATYSVFFINFDNPNPNLPPALHAPFLHWEEAGLAACYTSFAQEIQLFIPSVPESVGPNRYTFVIFREPHNYVANQLITEDRVILDINSFAASQNLTLVGGNYFLEGQIDNVPGL